MSRVVEDAGEGVCMDSYSDEQAINAVLQGNKEAFGVLVDRYKSLVFRLSMNTLQDPDRHPARWRRYQGGFFH